MEKLDPEKAPNILLPKVIPGFSCASTPPTVFMPDFTMVQGLVVAREWVPVHELRQQCDLPDEQIKQLLRNAETRLQGLEDSGREGIRTTSSKFTESLVGYARSRRHQYSTF